MKSNVETLKDYMKDLENKASRNVWENVLNAYEKRRHYKPRIYLVIIENELLEIKEKFPKDKEKIEKGWEEILSVIS